MWGSVGVRRLNEPKSRPNKPEGKTKQTKKARKERVQGCGGVVERRGHKGTGQEEKPQEEK